MMSDRMERPERPSRHKSNPMKYPPRPTFSSDSESEVNDNDVPIQITFYRPESSNIGGGPSTSSTTPQGNSTSVTDNSNNMRSSSPVLRVPLSLSPINIASITREEEHRSDQTQDVVRRKRSAASSAASVIFDSVDTLIGSNNSNRNSGSPERFQPSDYVIRPKSFCNMEGDMWRNNSLRPPVCVKLKRTNGGPIDLTPSTSNRESSAQPSVVTSSFSIQDNPTLSNNNEAPQSSSFYCSRNTVSSHPYGISARSSGLPSTSSTILRQFDELCSPNPPSSPMARRRRYVRFLEGYSAGLASGQTSSSPSGSRNNTTLDDYCDLVGNFLFNYPSSSQPTETQRSPPVAVPLERASISETQTNSTADILDRHAHSIISEINSYLEHAEPARTNHHPVIDGGEPMEQSNDDVIVVETPERPPLPGTPDPDIVPSSRSPSPSPPRPQHPPSTTATPSWNEKPQSSSSSDVPMTLPELNSSLVSLLECPVCLDHATPPIYQCIKGHILCQNCHPRLNSCPICRSRLPGDRNSVMEKVAEKLMYPCKNTVTGCTMMLKLDDKQAHEEGCGFRHYACIVSACNWKGYKPELVVHLQSNHPDKLITGATKELHVPMSGLIAGSGFIVHHWIQSAHNEVFHVVFNVDTFKRIMKGCVIYIGSREKAGKFRYLFELKQQVEPFRNLAYSRTTHVDTLKQGQPLSLRDDFSINIDMAQLYRPDNCCAQVIPIHITINQIE